MASAGSTPEERHRFGQPHVGPVVLLGVRVPPVDGLDQHNERQVEVVQATPQPFGLVQVALAVPADERRRVTERRQLGPREASLDQRGAIKARSWSMMQTIASSRTITLLSQRSHST